ncbi:hypothetical protein [Flavobacterium sp.]|uniref:hypothetical protein n=1 Tax=Flavobacterium sp. TaxID=239 RepID=UPI0038FC0368
MKRIYFATTIVFSLLSLISCGTGENHEAPSQLITQEMAKNLNTKYINERSGVISQSINREDANAIWYSIEELENYIHYIKTEGENKGIQVNGIRFYLGVYPNDTVTYHEKSGLTTIFLSPTKRRATTDKPNSQNTNKVALKTETEENVDATEIQPLNFGGMGNPPKIEYGGN